MNASPVLSMEIETKDNHKSLLLAGGICSIIVIVLTIMDIVIGTLLGGDLNTVPSLAIDRFAQLENQPWLGLYYLDALNLVTTILMIPVFTALFVSQRKSKNGWLVLALVIYGIGTAVFISNNAALPMYSLSQNYSSALPQQKEFLVAAGESLLAKGAHGSMGVFPGFILSMVATILMSISMIQSKVYGKFIGWMGLIGASLLLVYLVLVTFVPGAQSIAMGLAAPGGILSLIWMILYTIRLFRSAKEDGV